ncbi:hypothetical protein SNK03_004125 [Fusarium graminearum]
MKLFEQCPSICDLLRSVLFVSRRLEKCCRLVNCHLGDLNPSPWANERACDPLIATGPRERPRRTPWDIFEQACCLPRRVRFLIDTKER